MPSLILDQSAIDKLKTVDVRTEVRDRQGNLIGVFYPAVMPHKVDQYECPVGEEELLERDRQGGGRTLDCILEDLRKSQ